MKTNSGGREDITLATNDTASEMCFSASYTHHRWEVGDCIGQARLEGNEEETRDKVGYRRELRH